MRGRLQRLLHAQLAVLLLFQATHPWGQGVCSGSALASSGSGPAFPPPSEYPSASPCLDSPCPGPFSVTLSVSLPISCSGAWSTEAPKAMLSWHRRGTPASTSGPPCVELCVCLSPLLFLSVPTQQCLRSESINHIRPRPSLFTDWGWAQGQDKGEGELGLTPIQVSDQQARGEPVALLLPGKGDTYKRNKPIKGSQPRTICCI